MTDHPRCLEGLGTKRLGTETKQTTACSVMKCRQVAPSREGGASFMGWNENLFATLQGEESASPGS